MATRINIIVSDLELFQKVKQRQYSARKSQAQKEKQSKLGEKAADKRNKKNTKQKPTKTGKQAIGTKTRQRLLLPEPAGTGSAELEIGYRFEEHVNTLYDGNSEGDRHNVYCNKRFLELFPDAEEGDWAAVDTLVDDVANPLLGLQWSSVRQNELNKVYLGFPNGICHGRPFHYDYVFVDIVVDSMSEAFLHVKIEGTGGSYGIAGENGVIDSFCNNGNIGKVNSTYAWNSRSLEAECVSAIQVAFGQDISSKEYSFKNHGSYVTGVFPILKGMNAIRLFTESMNNPAENAYLSLEMKMSNNFSYYWDS